MKCPDCKGGGEYVPLTGPAEPCQKCKGVGELNDDGTVIDPKAKALDSVFNANLPSWMEDYEDQIEVYPKVTDKAIEELKKMFGGHKASTQLMPGGQCFTKFPRPAINDTLFVFDCDWYETKITLVYDDGISGVVMMRADYACGVFRIPEGDICWNVTQQRLECIRAGTPVWP